MAILVSFMTPDFVGSVDTLAVGKPRVYEEVATGGTTTAAAQDGEWALVVSTETTAVKGASGTTPDADATAETSATSAAFGVPPGVALIVALNTGDKLNFEAV